MATQIECVNKEPRNDIHKQIENVGGSNWKITQDKAIEEIEAGTEYEVSVGGQTVGVVIARHNGNKYIRTDPDRTTENNLLSLPECP
jgi:uncharacterized hydantoinase/oxoprolinase family protein